jgi:hypothetical protein
MNYSLARCICVAVAGAILFILLSLSAKRRSAAAGELSKLPPDAERQIIQRVVENPNLYSSYLAFDLFVENFQGVDDVIPNLRLESPYNGHEFTQKMDLKRFYGIADSIFGKVKGAELESVKRWIREGTTHVEDDGLTIVVKSPLFHETRSVLFDARVWVEEFVDRYGNTGVYIPGFSISSRGGGADVPSEGIMLMGPGSFNLEFRMRYDASRGTLRVVSAKVTPGTASEFVFDLKRIDFKYLNTRGDINLVRDFDPAPFSPYIHRSLADAMQGYMNRIFSKT